MKQIIWIILLSVWGISAGNAQNGGMDKKAGKYFQAAYEEYKTGGTDKVLELLGRAAAQDSSFSALYLLRADVFNRMGRRDLEVKAVERALGIDSLRERPFYFFVLADAAFDRGDYVTARKYYRLYLARDKRQSAAVQARRRLQNCDFAVEALRTGKKQPVELFLSGGEQSVYWPSLDVMRRTLLFTRQEGDRESIWMLRDSVRYPLFPAGDAMMGAPSLTADGKMMFFAMEEGHNRFDIYVAYRLSDTSWSAPVNLGSPVNTDGWEAQPAISADGTHLYFVSDREGGKGGSDIWYSHLIRRDADGRQHWSQPRCLYLNTPGNEMAPFLYFGNTTLFFSSDGYPGMGGLDICKADLGKASVPENIGITVNTHRDELGFIVDATGRWGYFSSDVSGKRCIYRYQLDPAVACPPASYIRLLTRDERGNPVIPDMLTVTAVATGDTLACYDGAYAYDDMLACVPSDTLLLIGAMKQGYLYYSDTLHVGRATSDEPLTREIILRKIASGSTLVLKGVFFDVDDHSLRPESNGELRQVVRFLNRNPEVRIEISGHTDNSGSAPHNLQLSEDRAFEVYKYLFLHRIAKGRMEYRGYGSGNPVAPNDTEAGKAANRRTEIRIK